MITTIRIQSIKGVSKTLRRLYSSNGHNVLPEVSTIPQSLSSIDLVEFRKNAFIPEKPVLISNGIGSEDALPASSKWFKSMADSTVGQLRLPEQHLSIDYLSPIADTILPYEYYSTQPSSEQDKAILNPIKEANNISSFLNQIAQSSRTSTFHRFNAPLSLFLSASSLPPHLRPKLYIAQAQIADLPPQLRADLPTPRLVQEAGKGDIYDANIWMGIPPTYTPLHKDPNPNLFVQLASGKRVRLFPPRDGMEIFRMVQVRIGGGGSASMRGYEMMEGSERVELERAVWGEDVSGNGVEAELEAGDALFIPKGWWHSIRSEGDGVNASVNWWFR